MRKVCVITGTRAEYGLLFWVMNAIKNDPGLELQIIATGMHLSPEFGHTSQEIEKDGFTISKKVEMLLSSDSKTGMAKSTSLAISGMSDALSELNPDLVVILGDRFEILAAATTCMLLNIPIAHCHGGESTFGLIDEPIRHSITKMSHLHFVSTEKYRKRVIQLGESPTKVFNVGALGVEGINKMKLMSKDELEQSLDFKFGKRTILVTFHPVTLEGDAGAQTRELVEALGDIRDCHFIFTMPNSDAGGHEVAAVIKDFVSKNADRAKWYVSLGQRRYLSALKHVDMVLGNSSSGILEVPSFGKPTVDIGMRQAGRICAASVIKCAPFRRDIAAAIEKGLSGSFQELCKKTVSPYGTGNSSEKIIKHLRDTDLGKILIKEFHDVDFAP